MKKITYSVLGLHLVMASSTVLAAENSKQNNHEIYSQIKVMEHSVNESSVSQYLSPEVVEESQQMLNKARGQARIGNYITAHQIVSGVGQTIYRMNKTETSISGYSSKEVWIREMISVIESLMPAANEIAIEKGRGQNLLSSNQGMYLDGLDAFLSGDMQTAEILIKGAYTGLQNVVSDLRSGDRLVIELPEENTAEAWQDADRRYSDWLFTSQKLIELSQIAPQEAEKARQMLNDAGSRYGVARELANSQKWGEAVTSLDDAFLIMQDSWRVLGIEI